MSKCEETKRSIIGVYLQEEFRRAGVTNREVAALFPSATGGLTGCVSNWILGYNMPTADQYAAMRSFLNGRGGNYLRREYEDLRRPFSVSEAVPYTDVWEYPTVNVYPGKHPCEKPLAMMEHIVKASSREGDTVLDCFAGSGTTGVAAAKHDRLFIGVEQDAHWSEVARRRIDDMRGVGGLF